MPETKTRSYDVAVSYTGKFVFSKENFEEFHKQIAESLDKLIAKEAKRPLTTEEKFQKSEAVRYLDMTDDQQMESLLKEAFKQVLAEQRKDLKGEGFTKLSPPVVTVTPRVAV